MTNQIPQNDPVDVAFHGPGAVRERKPVADCVVVASQSGDEAVQVGQVGRVDGGHPGIQALTVAAGEHLGEGGHVGGGGL